jgi:hypothetical protein
VHVFLAYARCDEPEARAAVDALRASSIDVWFDLERAVPGPTLFDQLATAIREAHALVWVARRDTPMSRWVGLELSWALDAGRPIYAIAADGGTDLSSQAHAIERALRSAAPIELATP